MADLASYERSWVWACGIPAGVMLGTVIGMWA